MIKIGYHGTNIDIEKWAMDKIGSNQGNSVFPGIYFADTYSEALYYANLATQKYGGKPIVYIAECELENPISTGDRIFGSYRDILDFTKEYFPEWFDKNGNLESTKVGYLKEKQSTYRGNYAFIQFASDHSGVPLLEVVNKLGFDSCLDGSTNFVITSPNQILSFEEVDHQLSEEELDKESIPSEEGIDTDDVLVAFETKSNDYVRAAKKGRPYKTKPGNRFSRRIRIKLNGGNNIWFDIDVNRLFKKGSFALKIPVIGETKEYVCSISFNDWLPKLKDDILKSGFTQMTVKRSLMEMLRFHDLKVRCTCEDFKYRASYWLSVHNEIEGQPETRPSKITNPHNDIGKICKHLSAVINNKIYGDKVSRIIYNYFINLKKTQKILFDKIVSPKLGLDILAQREEEAKKQQEEALRKQEEEQLETNGVEEPSETTPEEKEQVVRDVIGGDDNGDSVN